MIKIDFIDSAYSENKEYSKFLLSGNHKCIIAFEDEIAFDNWKKIMNDLAEVNQILKRHVIDNRYKIIFHKCKFGVQIRHLINTFISENTIGSEDIKSLINDYEKRYWMFVGFTYNDYTIDPIDSCMKRFIDFIEANEDADEINTDLIGMKLIMCNKE